MQIAYRQMVTLRKTLLKSDSSYGILPRKVNHRSPLESVRPKRPLTDASRMSPSHPITRFQPSSWRFSEINLLRNFQIEIPAVHKEAHSGYILQNL